MQAAERRTTPVSVTPYPHHSDMFLNYFALLLILIVLVIIFYVFIYIHELPYEAAKHRDHPQADAIYVACWLSLFTLHAIWPLVFIWALSHKGPADHDDSPRVASDEDDLAGRLTQLESRLRRLEERRSQAANESSVA